MRRSSDLGPTFSTFLRRLRQHGVSGWLSGACEVTHIYESDHAAFNRALRITTGATLGLLEPYVIQRVGRAEFKGLARDFMAQDGLGLTAETIHQRLSQFGL